MWQETDWLHFMGDVLFPDELRPGRQVIRSMERIHFDCDGQPDCLTIRDGQGQTRGEPVRLRPIQTPSSSRRSMNPTEQISKPRSRKNSGGEQYADEDPAWRQPISPLTTSFRLKARLLFWVSLLSLSLSCSKKHRPNPPKTPGFTHRSLTRHHLVAEFVDSKRSGFTGRYTQLKPGLTRLKAKAIQPELKLHRGRQSPPDMKRRSVTFGTVSSGRRLDQLNRSCTSSRCHVPFEAYLGPVEEGQINGRKSGFFLV